MAEEPQAESAPGRMPEEDFRACLLAFGRSFLAPAELTPLAREAIRSRAGEAAALARPLKIEYRDALAGAQRLEELEAVLGERAEQAHHLAAGRYGGGHHGTFASCGAEACRRVRRLLGRP